MGVAGMAAGGIWIGVRRRAPPLPRRQQTISSLLMAYIASPL